MALVDITGRRITSGKSVNGFEILIGRVSVGLVARVMIGFGACWVMIVVRKSGRHLEALTTFMRWLCLQDSNSYGVLSMYELEIFYKEKIKLIRDRGIDYMLLTDLLC